MSIDILHVAVLFLVSYFLLYGAQRSIAAVKAANLWACMGSHCRGSRK
jgi:hypothetical protein